MSSYSPKDRPVTRKMKGFEPGHCFLNVPMVMCNEIPVLGTDTGRLPSAQPNQLNAPASPYDYTPMPLAHLIDRLRHNLNVCGWKHCFRGTPLQIAARRLEAAEAILNDNEYTTEEKARFALNALHNG